MRTVKAAKSKEMRLRLSSKLWEVQESKHKDEVNSKEQNIGKSDNISSFRKCVVSVAVQVVSSARGYVGVNGNVVYLILHNMRFPLFL